MIALQKILVPTDFSDASSCALRYGRALAEAFGGSLHVLHVVDSLIAHAWSGEAYVTALPGLLEEVERAAIERLNGLLTPDERERLRAQFVVLTGSPFIEIIRYGRAQAIDLIVMGTHGRGPVEHMLLGSVAEKVVRKATCPVLTVRHPQHEFVLP
jgi:nucleotide-binding universal stress UspA family protein